MVYEVKCQHCALPAYVVMAWLTSAKRETAPFCREHAADFWRVWGGTPTGDTVSIFAVKGAPDGA